MRFFFLIFLQNMLDKIEKLKEALSKPKKIVITTHRGPDGDAMGSSLGLYHFLSKINHDVNVITPNDYASFIGCPAMIRSLNMKAQKKNLNL